MRDVDRSRPGEKMAAQQSAGDQITRIAYPIGSRIATLLRREMITDRMVRVTLGGAGLDGAHTYQSDDHMKLVFPHTDGVLRIPEQNERQMVSWHDRIGPTRDYTIRRYDAAAREIDFDVVLHAGGLASEWAMTAEIGSQIGLAGPPGAKAWPHTYDYYVMVGDCTALPAIARWLGEHPGAPTRVLIATEHPAQRDYPLALGSREPVVWLDDTGAEELTGAVEAVLGEGRGFLFAAGEAELIKPLRRWSKGRLDSVITGYWKRGVSAYDDD